MKLLHGKIRRMGLYLFKRDYVNRSLAARQGTCRRCGACCRLAIRCIHLRETEGLAACAIYRKRGSPNCLLFPLDQRDLADRDLLLPDVPCGFYWGAENSGGPDR